MPKVSVVMPAYNAEKYISEAIDSILEQTYSDFEFIIINDCSTDYTEEIILSYDDPRIVYLKNEKNMGVAATLNRGLAIAQGEYIARMDADDISLPERFEKQVQFLDNNLSVAVLGSAVERFGENGDLERKCFSVDSEEMKLDMFFSCGIAHPSVMLRRDVIAALGGYDLWFEGMEDYELWCRVMEKYAIVACPDVLLRYRIHGNQVTKNPSEKYSKRMRHLKIRQLDRLGISEDKAESYFNLCLGQRPETGEQAERLCAFLNQCIEENQKRKEYSQEKMRRYFGGVVTGIAAALPLKTAMTLSRNSTLVSLPRLLMIKIKKLITS